MVPKPIKTEADHARALAHIETLFDAKPGTARGDALKPWVTLVELYEEATFPIDMPDAIAAIRFRMDQQGLKTKDLVAYIGSPSKVSEVLSGSRELSKTMIRNLAAGLATPADVLLQAPGLKGRHGAKGAPSRQGGKAHQSKARVVQPAWTPPVLRTNQPPNGSVSHICQTPSFGAGAPMHGAMHS